VTAEDETTTQTYAVTVTRAALPGALTLAPPHRPRPRATGSSRWTAPLDEPDPADGTTVTLTVGGTATPDTDHTPPSTTITLDAEDIRGTATVTVIDDAEDERRRRRSPQVVR